MKPQLLVRTALGLCTAALIAGCNQASTVPTAQSERPEYVMSVPVTPQDTPQTLGARYGGRVVELNAEAGFAVVGLDAGAAKTRNLRAQALGDEPVAEPNIDQFQAGGIALMGGARSMWAGGARSMWAGGARSMWAGGARSMWAGGTYALVPENTAPFKQILLEKAHALAPGLGAGVKVAVIDTGIDLAHPAFIDSLAPATEWKDYVGNDALPQEQGVLGVGGHGHGTAVAGIVLQVAPLATILPIRVLDSDGAGDTDHVASAIYYAVEKGARVINLSLGSVTKSDVIEQAVKYATEKKNVLVVSSAGNDNAKTITFPAQHASDGADGERSLSVGSVNALDLKSSFSNYQKDRLELMAPGENIFTAGPDGLLVSWSGTSMAAPIVAGGLALALGQTLAVPLKDVTKKMAETGQDLYNNGRNSAYKDLLGKGRLDLEKFLTNAVKY
ncbi:S8 family serine peptidase [Deinococcus aestuarii]|uniref:S8 family serine peptidase n=1 Tax=Deinococcus aestuarii TaxID=2774531 RepID=UPI001C0E23A2|nr:S8 family serine peptidase [Deinococcus aestuarii]